MSKDQFFFQTKRPKKLFFQTERTARSTPTQSKKQLMKNCV